MSSFEPRSGQSAAPRTVDVLPARVSRRLTRRDGLLPLVLVAELVAGIAFGLASHAVDHASSVPAKLTLGGAVTALPAADPVPNFAEN